MSIGAAVASEAELEAQVEARTQRYGQQLLAQVQYRRAGWRETAEDQLFDLLAGDGRLRTQVLRLVDVMPSLAAGRDDGRLLELAREFLGPVADALPAPLALPLKLGLAGAVPAPWFARLARTAVQQMGRRFIVPSGRRGTWEVLRRLRAEGRMATFDVVGEAVVGERQAAAYVDRYLDMIEALGRDPDAGRDSPGGVRRLQISLKLSALTAHFDPVDPQGTQRRLQEPLERILDAARRAGVAVTWDVEQYAFRDLTWWLFQEQFGPGRPFGTWDGAGLAVQAYLVDSEPFVQQVVAFARRRGVPFQVRLVKGAYWDYETIVAGAAHWLVPVFQEKWQTDAQYERLTHTLLAAWPSLNTALGSHNVRSLAHGAAVADALGLAPEVVEYQTLYGMEPAISGALPAMGWLARDYVPSGDLLGGMAYLVRRLLENTSQVGFLRQSRADLDPEALLAPPRSARSSEFRARRSESIVTSGLGTRDSGLEFVPAAPARLFLSAEREAFAAAVERTRREWTEGAPAAVAAGGTLRIGGASVPSSAAPLVSRSPSHPHEKRPVAVIPAADAAATALAIHTANQGAPAWAARPAAERKAILRRAAEALLAARDEFGAWMVHEGGKDWVGALADVDEAVDYLRYYASQDLGSGYRPRGVVAVIPPWNFPLAIPCGMTSAALVTGNAVILKPAEQTPAITGRLVALLHRAGVPEDVLIHLPGTGETVGQALVESPDVDMIAFTGSREVGLHIAATAAGVALTKGGVKHFLAEMGGKNPVLVFADADLEEAAAGVLRSAFGHAGQKCSAASRVIVERPIFERLAALLVDGAESLPCGPADAPGTFINPVIDRAARDGILRWGEIARQEGRVLLDRLAPPRTPPPVAGCAGSTGAGAPQEEDGLLLGPLLVALQKEDAFKARIAQDEIFGPILPLLPFDSEAEAIAMANATSYGLTAGIFTRSPARARRVAAALRAGNVYVNREITGARVAVEPFGGVWLSGTGPKAGGPEYLYAFVKREAAHGDSGPAARVTAHAEPERTVGPAPSLALPALERWPDAPLERAEIIVGAARRLRLERQDVRLALQPAGGLDQPPDAGLVAALRAQILALVLQIPELAEPEPTYALPGQQTVTTWTTPRGLGLVVADDGATATELVAMVVGALLAGNGVAVYASHRHRQLARALEAILVESGVPPTAVAVLPALDEAQDNREPWLAVARSAAEHPLAFAAASLAPEPLRQLAAHLARPWPGQRWIKALISLDDGPAPGEPGFLRRFALPKTIATRTLRHGADLGGNE